MKNSLFVCFFLSFASLAQTPVLYPEAFLKIVQTYHPLAKQANIGVQKSEAQILQARGGFDPILSHYSTQKTFDGKNYYNYHAPELSIPTWYGIEVNSGIENLQGSRLNPNQTLGETSYIGITVPLAKNLVMDQRRASLQQAKLMNKMALQEQRSLLNDLFADAMASYWNWVKSVRVLRIVDQNLKIAEARVSFVKQSVELGERPSVDTIEATTQLQYFENLYQEKWVERENSRLSLSVYLWQENNTPQELSTEVQPADVVNEFAWMAEFDLNLNSLLEKAYENHPDLSAYQFKIEGLQIEKRLKFQSLLPKLDFTYNALSKGSMPSVEVRPLFENNYQYGIKFEMPLRLSKGRADYQLAKLKIQEESLNLAQKRQQIQVKVSSYFNQVESLKKQIDTQQKAVSNYQALVKAEEARFAEGESSLFLINSRETKAMEAAEKLTELKAYLFKAIYALQASAGVLI
ncbi:TolC family protein [Aquirufa sp. HETE-40SA]